MNYKINNKKGFTLIEMLVSVAIFSIIITMIMGTIVTITDASRKARTLTEVMNNLNFSFESMTRTLKTAKSIVDVDDDSIEAVDQNGRKVVYTFSENGITKNVEDQGEELITSEALKLTSRKITYNSSTGQPSVFFSVKGRVETAKGIASEFTLQSTVSQRQLQLY